MLKLEQLEDRRTPAVSLTNGVLLIEGSAGNDFAAVTYNAGGKVSVTLNNAVAKFDAADVDSILFLGGNGNDTLINRTDIDLVALAGDGNDIVIQRGNGDTQLFGGAGNDRLDCWLGDDFIDGGDGTDTVLGRAGGTDTFINTELGITA